MEVTVLIGAHVSTAGGLLNAVQRGTEKGCEAIQIFNQSPRAWKPTAYTEEDFAAFKEAMADSKIQSVVIHMIYLINPAGSDRTLRRKSLASLTHAMRVGDAIDAAGVVIHPGALKGGEREPAKKRSAQMIADALSDSERCPALLENTAGNDALLGRDFAELGDLIDLAGGGDRLGLCIDTCHLHASGYDVRSKAGVEALVDEMAKDVGVDRLSYLHVNDSRDACGSNRDRHANIGEGEIGKGGFRAFLSEPRLQGTPAVLETPGPDGQGSDRAEVSLARRLWREGLRSRKQGASRK